MSTLWSAVTPAEHGDWQSRVLHVLASQRALPSHQLHLHRVALPAGNQALVAGNSENHLWPLGRIVPEQPRVKELVQELLDQWQNAFGSEPEIVVADQGLSYDEAQNGTASPWLFVPESEDAVRHDPAQNEITAHHRGRRALQAALESFSKNRIGDPETDLTMALTANALLRTWARWLKQFANSSVSYLLENFIYRSGMLHVDTDTVVVEMSRAALDVVIEMAGYTAELERLPWLGKRRVRFELFG